MNNTNEEGKILYATILPILVLVMILVGAGFFLLRGEFELPKFRREETELVRLEGFPTITSNVDQMDKQRLVIKSQTELNEFLNKVDPEKRLVIKEDINFKKDYVLAVATETNETYGYEIKIKKVQIDEEDNTLLVQVEETQPHDDCTDEYDRVPNLAVDIAVISKTDKEFEFERIKEIVECESEEEETSMESEEKMVEEDTTENIQSDN